MTMRTLRAKEGERRREQEEKKVSGVQP